MAETDVKCVKLKSDQRSIYRMNQFYWIHCYQHQKRKKSLTCHEEKWGSRGSLCLVADKTRCRPVSCREDVTGLSRTSRGSWHNGIWASPTMKNTTV